MPVTLSGVPGLTIVFVPPISRLIALSVGATVTFTLLVTESPDLSTIVTNKP